MRSQATAATGAVRGRTFAPRRWAIRVLTAVALAAASVAFAPDALAWEAGSDGLAPIPPLTARVTDLTQTLNATERGALEAKLADWEARTTNQLAVLLVPSTQPEPIEAYAIRVADAWKIGRKGSDNGVLLVVAKNDRKVRIEVGYGLEGTLTDVTSRRIIAESIAPAFRDGRFGAGLEAGTDRIISVVAEGKPLPPAKAGNTGRAPREFDPGMGGAHKLRRGFRAVVNYSLHRFTDPFLRKVMERNISALNRLQDEEIDALNQELPLHRLTSGFA